MNQSSARTSGDVSRPSCPHASAAVLVCDSLAVPGAEVPPALAGNHSSVGLKRSFAPRFSTPCLDPQPRCPQNGNNSPGSIGPPHTFLVLTVRYPRLLLLRSSDRACAATGVVQQPLLLQLLQGSV